MSATGGKGEDILRMDKEFYTIYDVSNKLHITGRDETQKMKIMVKAAGKYLHVSNLSVEQLHAFLSEGNTEV